MTTNQAYFRSATNLAQDIARLAPRVLRSNRMIEERFERLIENTTEPSRLENCFAAISLDKCWWRSVGIEAVSESYLYSFIRARVNKPIAVPPFPNS
jgi:hypothetical protein